MGKKDISHRKICEAIFPCNSIIYLKEIFSSILSVVVLRGSIATKRIWNMNYSQNAFFWYLCSTIVQFMFWKSCVSIEKEYIPDPLTHPLISELQKIIKNPKIWQSEEKPCPEINRWVVRPLSHNGWSVIIRRKQVNSASNTDNLPFAFEWRPFSPASRSDVFHQLNVLLAFFRYLPKWRPFSGTLIIQSSFWPIRILRRWFPFPCEWRWYLVRQFLDKLVRIH